MRCDVKMSSKYSPKIKIPKRIVDDFNRELKIMLKNIESGKLRGLPNEF